MLRLLEKGAERLMGPGDWAGMTASALLMDLSVADSHVLAITGATTATPAVLTTASTALMTTGDIVSAHNIGGMPELSGTFKVTVLTGTTFSLQTLRDELDVVGTGTYSSGGVVVNLTAATNVDAVSAGRSGDSSDASVGSKTETDGNLGCGTISWPAFTGSFEGFFIYEELGAESSDNLLIWVDGRVNVVCAAAAVTTDTSIAVEKLPGALPLGAVLTFSNGQQATLSGAAAVGDRVLSVNALSGGIPVGHQAEPFVTNPGFPGASAGSTFDVSFTGGVILTRNF